MEYAVRQAAAIALEGWEVHFLCKESFPRQRLPTGIRVINFEARRETFCSTGKLRTIWRFTIGSRRISQQIFEIAEKMHFEFVLFACFKEYFSPFWVWPLRRLAKKGVVIGTIAHDPLRDFVVGPLWWHRCSVRLGYSFISHVFVHDDTPVDFGGKRPEGIQIHRIPHGPYEVAEPKIGREAMRRRLGFDFVSTTEDTENTEKESRSLSLRGTANVERAAARLHLAGRAGTSEPDSIASELANSPASESHTRSASDPASALCVDDAGIVSARGNQLADSKEVLEDQSQAGLQMDSQKHQSIRAANDTSASKGHASSVPIREIRGSNSEALEAGRSILDSAPKRQANSPATSYPSLATPASPDVVFLAFGQIRDGKNLDLFLRAMTILPNHVKLLVAGKGDSGSSKPPEFYQKLAEEFGVADRCQWDIRRIPEDELGDIFAACDVVLVTYSAKFRSASGVLNAAVSARKPVLASSGPGPLKTVVNKYLLGVFIEPDNFEEVLRGARQISDSLLRNSKVEPGNEGLNAIHQTRELHTLHSTLDSCFPLANSDSGVDTSGGQLPAWEQYERENSWKVNANAIMNLISASNRNA